MTAFFSVVSLAGMLAACTALPTRSLLPSRTGGCPIEEINSALPPPRAPETINAAQRKSIWDSTLTAGINERYWSALANEAQRAEWWKTCKAIITGFIAFAIALAPRFFGWTKRDKVKTRVADVASLIIFTYSMIQFVNYGSSANDLSALQRRWACVATESKNLLDRQIEVPPEEMKVRIDSLRLQVEAIEQSEPPGKDHGVMHSAWIQEMHSLGQDDWGRANCDDYPLPAKNQTLNGANTAPKDETAPRLPPLPAKS